MTLQEYFRTPETLMPQELIDGIVRVADAPYVHHQRIVLRLAIALHRHVTRHGLGEVLVAPVDVVLDPDRPLVVQPDLLFVSEARRHIVGDRVMGAPDVAVEILSPRARIGSLETRVRWFASYGVREIWVYNQTTKCLDILDCDGTTVVARRSMEDWEPVDSRVLPMFTGLVGTVFGQS